MPRTKCGSAGSRPAWKWTCGVTRRLRVFARCRSREQKGHTRCVPVAAKRIRLRRPILRNPSCARTDGDGASWFRRGTNRSLKDRWSPGGASADRWSQKTVEPACRLLSRRFAWPPKEPWFKPTAGALVRHLQRRLESSSGVRSCMAGKLRSSYQLPLAIA